MTRRYYAVLAKVSLSYPPLQGRLVTCYSPVRHFTQVLLPFLVRLACVRHAASVDSEPGSNSRLKPAVPIHATEVAGVETVHPLLSGAPYLVRMIKPNLIVSHDWHVQPYCQRSFKSGPPERCPFWIEARAVTPRLSSNLLRYAKLTLLSGNRHFCANLLNLSKFRCRVKLRNCSNLACYYPSLAGSFTCLFDRHSGEVSRPQKVALRKISKSDRHRNA